MCKRDETLDLLDRERRPILADLLNACPAIKATHHWPWQNACAPHDGLPRNFARNTFDQFTTGPIDVNILICHAGFLSSMVRREHGNGRYSSPRVRPDIPNVPDC